MGMIIDPAKSIMRLSSLNKGLVLHQPLDKESLQSATTFADKTPYENVGTKYGSVLKFDRANDFVNIGQNASLNIGGDDFTIGFWVKPEDPVHNAWQGLVYLGFGASNNGHVGIQSNTGLLAGGTGDGSGWQTHTTSYEPTTDWQHIVMRRASDILYFYVDGIFIESFAHNYTPSDIDEDAFIGLGHTTEYFDGSIGDTRIYSRALTPAEVLTMYQGGVVSDTDLEAHYKFGDKSGTTLTDETANNNDGTLTNFADTTAEYGNTHDSGWVTDDTPNVFALDRMGQVGRSLAFDGSSDFVEIDGNYNSATYFISLWIKPADITTAQYITETVSASKRNLILGYPSGYFNLYSSGYPTGSQVDTQFVATINEWQHIVAGTDGTKVYVYKNGVKVIDVTGTWTNVAGTGMYLGRLKTKFGYNLNGSLADVRIYNRALSTSEITMLYEQYRPKLLIAA